MTCPSCGAQTSGAARYCASCGHPLQPERGDERRIVTVVFADLAGYTALAEGRDPEHVKNLVDRCFERLAADVVAHGGRVDKVVGDAIMALFGAPVAHEDDAERAVRAGLTMQRTLVQWADELGVAVQLRVGINTGEVLVGALRAGGDYTAMGDVVNTASRLQQAAEPGQVLVGPETHAATRAIVRYESAGLVRVRGREEPVGTWIAVGTVAPPGRRPRRPRTPMVGRDAEMGLLLDTLRLTAERRRPAVVVLTGEAGTGKSRLAEDLAARARADLDAMVLEGRCLPYGESNVWWPLGEALRRACGIDDTDDHAVAKQKGIDAVSGLLGLPGGDREVQRVVKGLGYLMAEGEAPDLEPSRARDEAVRSMALCLEQMTATRPLVFTLSELHWGDALLLELLDRLLDRIAHLPVLLVATARPELAERWHPPAGRHHQLVIHVEPLDAAATAELLETLLEGAVPPELRDELVRRSGGNPLFLEELVALMATDRDVDELPVTLRGLIAARLDALGPSERGTLENAAVIGRRGSVAELVAMAGEDRAGEVSSAVAALTATELLAAAPPRAEGPAWEFRSEMVREVAYGTLTKAERARRHAGFAAWRQSRVGERPTAPELDELAHHFATAAELAAELGGVDGVPPGLLDDALRWLREAARRAEAEELWRPAAELLDLALRLLGDDGETRLELLLSRARARIGLREVAGATADLDEVLRVAAETRDTATEMRGLVLAGELQRVEGRLEESTASLRDAVALARSRGDEQCVADALRALGQTRVFAGDSDGADEASSEALAAYRSLGDRRGEAWALQSLAWTAFLRGDLVRAEERLQASAAAFGEIQDWGGLAWAEGLLAWVRYVEGRLDEADRISRNVLQEARTSGDAWAHAMMTVLSANIGLWKGRTAEAVEQAAEARRLFRSIADFWGEAQAIIPQARGLIALGDILAARRVFDELGAPAGKDGGGHMGAMGFDLFVVAARAQQLGEGPEALEVAAAAGAVVSDWVAPDQAGLLGLCRLQAGDVDGALEAFARGVETHPGRLAGQPSLSANLALALLAAGRVDDALATLDVGVPPGAGTYVDQTWAALGRAFAAARRGDPSGVRAFIGVAFSTVDPTGDRLLAATARVGAAAAASTVGLDVEGLDEAEATLAAIGAPIRGWRTVFALASGAVQPSTVAAAAAD